MTSTDGMTTKKKVEKRQPKNKHYILQTIKYLRELGVDIHLPKETYAILAKESFRNYTDGGSFPSQAAIKAVVNLFDDIWKKYIKEEDKTLFVVAAISSLFRIHCCVISASFLRKNGIELINPLPTPGYKSIISETGFTKDFFDAEE